MPFQKDNVPWNKGRLWTEQELEKISVGVKASNLTRIPNISKAKTGKHYPKLSEAKLGLSAPYKGLVKSAEHCRNISLSKMGKPSWNKGVVGYRNRPYPQSFYDSRGKCLVISKPTNPEIELGRLIEIACPGQYTYTGNGSLIIQGICPDYANVNGQKKVIEMFGNYWHSEGSDSERIEKFKLLGFDCLVIWQSDLVEKTREELISTIQKFNER